MSSVASPAKNAMDIGSPHRQVLSNGLHLATDPFVALTFLVQPASRTSDHQPHPSQFGPLLLDVLQSSLEHVLRSHRGGVWRFREPEVSLL